MGNTKRVLISGASFAGLTTAYWMNKMGYKVTVVETSAELKKGGTPVDIKDQTVDIVKRMGLFEQIKAKRLCLERWEFKDGNDVTIRTMLLREAGQELPDNEFEIERDVLLQMLFDLIKDDVNFIFNNSITALDQEMDFVQASFRDSSSNRYELVFGCDGLHSNVRKICFGAEDQYVKFLGQYFSIAIIDKYLIPDATLQLYAEPNKGIMLNAYNNKTDIVFTFRPEKEIVYDFRDQDLHKQIVNAQFEGMGWRTNELQMELLNAKSFYFDKFCQVKMPSWSRGRVVLVGDAGYCASPAAGMGGSLAIIGATAVSDAFQNCNGNHELAFVKYDKDLRPFIDQVQADALEMLDKLLPRTQEEIDLIHKHGF
ncbi:MAG: FAD-binding monooxygenase [Pedobacter sp.]|nr:MAG: FAD-binding monooxygenase [Pedobacter sp.]